jgi:hypothetical protein
MQQCYNNIVVKGYHVELFMLCVLNFFVVYVRVIGAIG